MDNALTIAIMLGLILFLVFMISFQSKRVESDIEFFDVSNTQAMRGVWCIVIMLVHVPSAYTNTLQGMIGSFAYVGVTFFFMVSAFGLKQKSSCIKGFWVKRLFKLLLPCVVSNFFLIGMNFLKGESVAWYSLLYINHWVVWLIVCYVIYWLAYKVVHGRYQDVVIIIGVMILSLIMYFAKSSISIVTWPPEVLGFAWGIILANYRDKLLEATEKRWIVKNGVVIIIAGTLGVLYLKYKYMLLWGDYLLKILLGIAILLLILIANTHITIGNKISNYLGQISYEVYLIHGGVYGLVSHFFPTMSSGIYITFNIVITIVLSSIVHNVCTLGYGKIRRSASVAQKK